jgi:hypothetical protein
MPETYPPAHLHVHSARLASGDEVLIARVKAADGRIGYGFSLSLDATEARHMAERFPAELPAEIRTAIDSIRWLPA